ncbi:SURF1 family cytochrome oxidase biogenesis protein [Catenuloplanes atrovinosus]|uniref:SURF1-like protein n=1 Tax=Catenuloplanes atrovinosus TaxID=137266 RepID=A0AAE3YUC0_9ACTN|nr:SURF1 family protein [Catenuloplanes atrovinosus]MDR7278770.1 cytochrome oxidase assembly protein ShyY1 [Catenuloplanes atrovinosus]
MYRFLFTPRWLGYLALALAAAGVMVLLGNWQLSRYQERSAINDRIDRADSVAPVPLTSTMDAPDRAGTPGTAPGKDVEWTRVTVTGVYDPANEILARSRTVAGQVGFEVITPLRLPDGTAVLIDRGWIPPAEGDALARPAIPPAPTGTVTVIGKIHLSESKAGTLDRRDGRLETRRIGLPTLAPELPYPIYGAYLLLTEQQPAADPAFVQIEARHENAWQNGGYAVQWWLFAALTLAGFIWLAHREARGPTTPTSRLTEDTTPYAQTP